MEFKKIEKKWQKKWEQEGIFEVKESKKKKFYVLDMFPYPSGAGLHMGHAFVFTLGDIFARFKRMQGFNVLYPIGYDALGLPAENAAIKVGIHPSDYTKNSIKNFMKQQKAMGWSYDWSRVVNTSEPEFYKWDQWIFLKMLEKGIAYRKKAPVNWCPKCETVLANEQVENGKCWRHEDTSVQIKHLEQWFLRTTKYAEDLIFGLDKLDWSDNAKKRQRNWIGKSYGTEIDFEVEEKNISNVVIVHGSPKEDRTKEKDYVPDSKKAWIGWTKKELDKKGVECVCPQMPTPWDPKYSEWKKVFEKIPINKDSILVGTSAGGGFLVRWLGETKTKIKKLILVSPGKVGKSDRLNKFYGNKFYKEVKDLVSEKIVIYTSEDDYDYHIESAEEYAKDFGGKFVKFRKGYGHFTSKTLVNKEFPELLNEISSKQKWPIFTTRPDTIFGVTFMVVSAQHEKLMELVTKEQKKEVEDFLKKLKSVSEKVLENLEKEGVFTGSYAVNPLTNEKVPIYAGNFVVADYGSGMVMAVPAHDQRDFEFAKKYGIDIKQVIEGEITKDRAYTREGNLINSGEFNGINSKEAIGKISDYIEKNKIGKRVVNYKLRDWLISRQRYWGTPIPVVYCEKCGVVPVPEKELPVKLPKDVKFGKGNPLLTNEKWLNVKCPKCNGKARRETDTMDTFANSSWYYLRYTDPKNNKKIFDSKKANYWCPIDQYIGGPEHITMHLIYIRFYTKFLREIGLIDFDEPAMRYFTQGIVHASDGEKMSKSKGNVVEPFEFIKKYGADTLRLALISFASPDSNMNWDEKIVLGSHKFLLKVFSYFSNFKEGKCEAIIESKFNRAIKEITNDVGNFKHNLAVIKLRQLLDDFSEKGVSKDVAKKFLKMLHIYCPFLTEELWEKLGNKGFVSLEKWPEANESKINEKLEEQEKQIENVAKDVKNILRILKARGEKNKKIVEIYAVPNEVDFYKENLNYLEKAVSLKVEIFNIKDAKETGKTIKAKPGKPGILIEPADT